MFNMDQSFEGILMQNYTIFYFKGAFHWFYTDLSVDNSQGEQLNLWHQFYVVCGSGGVLSGHSDIIKVITMLDHN